MRHLTWLLLLFLLGLGACGDDHQQTSAQAQAQAQTQADTGAPTVRPSTTPAGSQPDAEPGKPQPVRGRVKQHPEAGFSIYWPEGCERLNVRESDGATRLAAREIITSCVREDLAFTVRYLGQAHDINGEPPHPRLVVSLVEEILGQKKLRTLRQRPLEAGRLQGVEVQAEGNDSGKRAWIRGFLAGTDVYILLALGDARDIFERGEVQDFFFSFNLDVVPEG